MKILHSPSKQHGVAAVELAFVLVFMLLAAAGTFEFGRAFWYYNALAKATRDGARVMSVAPVTGIVAAGDNARAIVVAAANGANVYPALTVDNVEITCDGSACADDAAPASVRVDIVDYTIDIGGIFPFFATDYSVWSATDVSLAPHATMRYMG
jgi:hypothetical protein